MSLAIIPARGGSQRIKSKNIKDFFGKPVIYYAIRLAKQIFLIELSYQRIVLKLNIFQKRLEQKFYL